MEWWEAPIGLNESIQLIRVIDLQQAKAKNQE